MRALHLSCSVHPHARYVYNTPLMGRLDGKRALVTGAGDGIGRSIAALFAREGARVAVLDINPTAAEETCRQIDSQGGHALSLAADVGNSAQVAEALTRLGHEFGGLEILVNNAGISRRALFENLSDRDWDDVISTNLKGAIHCTRSALPLLKCQPGGKIINIASVTLSHPSRRLSAYSATKGALASLSRSLALELGPHSICVNYICPGYIRTEMTRPFHSRWLFRKYVEHRTPLGRFGEPEDVARVALFLASPDSDFVTGAGITVDGGLTLRLS